MISWRSFPRVSLVPPLACPAMTASRHAALQLCPKNPEHILARSVREVFPYAPGGIPSLALRANVFLGKVAALLGKASSGSHFTNISSCQDRLPATESIVAGR